MRQATAMLLAALLASAGALAQAQSQPKANDDSTVEPAVKAKQSAEIRKGDPSRWQQGDATRQARLKTLQKEIGAAYAEAKNACRENAAAGRAACLKDARATYEQDMKNAPAQLDAAPEGSVQTTRTVQTPAQN